ncbi:hypothetical protein FE257_003495 [Aspergillus nanangensis]|uniref:Zn(2)-C6 fungal-type domain-containing protein n=1 Tax=Aspergillus nanangensis TaxID=2582783 RepID=A0AAD4CCV0_ASPNN|nr:hypothetical protein FE257_003495 [Aspergillus nanangensis]
MGREASDGVAPRVWQACISCRRKKVKCDGNNPCHNCGSRELVCEYPGSNDNASSSRSYATMFEARFQQLDTLCQRLETVAAQLTRAIEKLPSAAVPSPGEFAATELGQVSQNLQSLLDQPLDATSGISHTEFAPSALSDSHSAFPGERDVYNHGTGNMSSPGKETDDDLSNESVELTVSQDPAAGILGSLVPDSFIGGASNDLLVKSIQSLTPVHPEEQDLPAFAMRRPNGPTQIHQSTSLEVPLFVQGIKWRELPFLPKPEDLNLPPRYVADMLVGLYFDQFHYTFPVLFKPQFMDRYRRLYMGQKGWERGFLSVFFAVCACASSLTPTGGTQSAFPGLEFYEKALLLHFSTTGQAGMERIQCLALISMCCSGWNTLSSSWNFAGQAVRAAQDVGMHLSGVMTAFENTAKGPGASLLEAEMARRIWWSIYCLDRVTSTCLGRPMAINDSDCCCALPRSVSDEELEVACHASPDPESADPVPDRKPRHKGSPGRNVEQMRAFTYHNCSILDRGPNLTMSILIFTIHAGSLLNLYRTFSNEKGLFTQLPILKKCISAARGCVNAAELVRDFVPPSHYLAFSVHCLTISGLALFWMKDSAAKKPDPDVEKCIRFLHDLEGTWSGASRGRAIIEQSIANLAGHPQGSLLDLDLQVSSMSHNTAPDLFNWDLSILGGANFWGTM